MKWSKEKCREMALYFNKRSDFEDSKRGAYMSALKNGWLDEICQHMKPIKILSEEDCKLESMKYENRSDLSRAKPSVYKKILKNGWTYMFDHMNRNYVNDNRCIYAYEFEDGFVYIGLTKNLERRTQQHMSKGSVFEHIKICKIYKLIKLTDYINIQDAVEKETEYLNIYTNKGFSILNKIKTGGIGSTGDINKSIFWTKERCENESLKYKVRSEFKKGSPSAYQSSLKNKWLDDICKHMIEVRKPKGYWSFENCKLESMRYKNKNEFQIKSPSAYFISYKNNWLKILFEEK